MSVEYDQYLKKHISAVKEAFQWLCDNLPSIIYAYGYNNSNYANIKYHDGSKYSDEEYEAYDAYFYGRNRSSYVMNAFNLAWLHHIHNNKHHWQHWVLINDDPKLGEVCLEMPYCYVIEMICDWWSFSFYKGDLTEIFFWYDEHKEHIKLAKNTRKMVEYILSLMKDKLGYDSLAHHGVKGQKWGVQNGPPYPLDKSEKKSNIVNNAIKAGEVSKRVNYNKQHRHTMDGHVQGKSYINGDESYAQELIDKYAGTGEAITKNGEWKNKERICSSDDIGIYVDSNGNETSSNTGMIVYSKTGSHIYPAKRKENKNNA